MRDARPHEVDTDATRAARARMVTRQLAGRDIRNPRVLEAMRAEPRHVYVSGRLQGEAYEDHPLPIGEGQTISQPYVVASMTEHLRVAPGMRVLEIGTGSGYQTAILARLGAEVFSIEIVEALCARSRETLELTLPPEARARVHLRCGDGYRGWPEAAPFERVIVTAAPPRAPAPLVEQLAPGGRMVIPVGDQVQALLLLRRDAGGELHREHLYGVRFVPMTGDAQAPDPEDAGARSRAR